MAVRTRPNEVQSMMTIEPAGQPELTECCSHWAYLLSSSTIRNLCVRGASIFLFFREPDAHGRALVDRLAILQDRLVAPLADRVDRRGIVHAARARVRDDDVRGGAVGPHGELEFHPAVRAAIAQRGRKLRRHVFG